MTTTQDIVQKLWSLCDILRDDGITYQDYVTELTFLLFLKMTKETDTEKQLPAGHRWDDLKKLTGNEQLDFYRQSLIDLGAKGSPLVKAIYANANTSLKKPTNLQKLVDSIDALDWYSARTEGLGELYEGLLEKNATEMKQMSDEGNVDEPASPWQRVSSPPEPCYRHSSWSVRLCL